MIYKAELFKGKNFLVTGANSGLGFNLSCELLKCGAKVTGVSRSINKADFFDQSDILPTDKFRSISLDLKEQDLNFEKKQWDKPFDGVFLAAGVSIVSSFIKTSDDTIDTMFNVNVLSQLKLIRFFLKNKLLKPKASIVFMSSVNGTTIGSKGHSIYAATKGALNGVTMSLANELSKKSIRVNSIAAGLVKTPMFIDNLRLAGEDSMNEYEKTYPLGFGHPEDVTNLAVFLLSDASKWITGQTHIIDGGHSIS